MHVQRYGSILSFSPLGSGLGPSVGSVFRGGGSSENFVDPWSLGQQQYVRVLLMENILLSFLPKSRGGCTLAPESPIPRALVDSVML